MRLFLLLEQNLDACYCPPLIVKRYYCVIIDMPMFYTTNLLPFMIPKNLNVENGLCRSIWNWGANLYSNNAFLVPQLMYSIMTHRQMITPNQATGQLQIRVFITEHQNIIHSYTHTCRISPKNQMCSCIYPVSLFCWCLWTFFTTTATTNLIGHL